MRNFEVLHINLRLYNDLKGLGAVQMAAQGAKRPLGGAQVRPPARQHTSGRLMGSAGHATSGARPAATTTAASAAI